MECGCRTIVHIYNYVESKVNTCKLRGVTSGRGGLFDVSTTCCVAGTSWYDRKDARKREREQEEKKKNGGEQLSNEEGDNWIERKEEKNKHTGTYTHTDRSTSTHTS